MANASSTVNLMSEANDIVQYIPIKGMNHNENDILNMFNLRSSIENEEMHKFFIKYQVAYSDSGFTI